MIVCMASGNGSNFEAIVKSGIKIDLVITNRETARVIDRAKKLYKQNKYTDALQYIGKLKEKIRKFRKAGLDRAGEFSSENIAFKALRRNNYLEKLSNLKHMGYDKLMSKTSDGLITVKINETVQNWKEFIKG